MPRVNLDRLRELHAQGLSDPKIAAELGCCQKSVCNWRRRLKLSLGGQIRHRARRFSDDDLRALHAQGLNDVAIAKRLGVSRGAVHWRRLMLDLRGAAGKPEVPFDRGALLAHHAAGLTDPEIAALMGITAHRVAYQRLKLGLPGNVKRGSALMSNDTLRALHAQGLNDRQIAERVELAVATVSERRRKMGLPVQMGRRLSVDMDRVAQLRGEGLSYTEIGRRLDCGRNTVRRACVRLGLTQAPEPKPNPRPAPARPPVNATAAPAKAAPTAANVPDRPSARSLDVRPVGLKAMIEMARRESAAMRRAGRI